MNQQTEYNFYPFNQDESKYQKIIYKNRCVLVPKETATLNHLCGYVVFRKTDIPKDWWGNYNAVGLNKLMVHGGLTYCSQQGIPNKSQIIEEYNDKIKKVYDETKPTDGIEKLTERMKKVNALRDEMNNRFSETDEGYVVFGFDCGHYNDENNPALKDPNHVMMLTEQMEDQLLRFKERYEEYRDAEGVIKNVVRNSIMDEVHRNADFRLEPGFGALLDMLSGEDD